MFGRLATRGHDVTLVASGWPGAAPRETLDGIHVHRVGSRYGYLLAAPRHYRRQLTGVDFDVAVEDLNKAPLFTPRWVAAPVVLLVHHLFGGTAFAEATFPVAAATWLLERPLPRAYRGVPVEVVSPSTADDLVRRGFDRERIRVIPNGVDVERYRPDPATPRFPDPTVLYLGRLKRYKGVDLVVRAVGLLRDRGVVVRFLVAGRGDFEPELRRLRHELELEDRVELLGYVGEEAKVDLFRRAWIHVLASEKEGWGLTNLEAGACATPTVASDAPGLRDSVRDGETGLLVPHGDVAALADALGTLVADADLRERLGRNARSFALEFSWDRAADRTASHLEEVRAGAARSRQRKSLRGGA